MFSFFKKIYWNVFSTHQWFILYRDNGDGKWIRLKQPIDVSRADAFVVMENGKVYIFFEEFKIEERHGYLCVGELNKTKQSLDNVRVVLEKKYHLSFPNVFKYQDKYYMIPESHENNSIELYEFVDFPYKLKKTRDLISNVNAVDSVFLQKDNLCYLFTNKYTHKDCLHSENLSIFVSDDLLLFRIAFRCAYSCHRSLRSALAKAPPVQRIALKLFPSARRSFAASNISCTDQGPPA